MIVIDDNSDEFSASDSDSYLVDSDVEEGGSYDDEKEAEGINHRTDDNPIVIDD